MNPTNAQFYTAFESYNLLAHGKLDEVVLKVKKRVKADPTASILIFSDSTGKEMDFDLRGSEKEILQRLHVFLTQDTLSPTSPGPGRPKLGVVAREVSLLPRHWEWLSTQSGGASATIRRLVEEAKKSSLGKDQIKIAQDRAFKFMSSIGGNLPGFEEAIRALYAKDRKKFKEQLASWPSDIKEYAQTLANSAFDHSS